MATQVHTDVGSSTGISGEANSSESHLRADKNPVVTTTSTNPVEAEPSLEELKRKRKEVLDRKYKHVFAIHSKPRTSCLSHEAVEVPSFLGFRNLMVLVLSKLYLPDSIYGPD